MHVDIRTQFEALGPVQQHQISMKIEDTDMLPVLLGVLSQRISLDEPDDFTRPMSPQKKRETLDFITRFTGKQPQVHESGPIAFKDDPADLADDGQDDNREVGP